jgi:hypothetical protein
MFSGVAWLRRPAGWARDGVAVTVGAVAVLAAFAPAPVFAAGEKGGESGGSPGESAATSDCPSSNPPNQMTLVAGTPQTALVGTAFATGLQATLANSDGCPVTSAAAGIPVTFSSPPSGASGVFSTTGTGTAIVGADASGTVVAPPFTANGAAGSYTVTATSRYGSVSFTLTNAPAGVWCPALERRASASAGQPVKLTPGVGSTQSTPAGRRFAIRLAVTVTDAEGNPVPGAPVTFSAPAGGPSGRFTTRTQNSKKTHARVSHPRGVTIRTGACGIAVAPAFTANDRRGGYIVKATVEHVRQAAFALVNEAPAPSS